MKERKGEDKVDHKPEKGKSLFKSAADPPPKKKKKKKEKKTACVRNDHYSNLENGSRFNFQFWCIAQETYSSDIRNLCSRSPEQICRQTLPPSSSHHNTTLGTLTTNWTTEHKDFLFRNPPSSQNSRHENCCDSHQIES